MFTFKVLWRRLQCAEVRRRPVQTDQPEEAFDKPRRLPLRHAEQHFHRKAGQDGSIAVVRLATTFASGSGLPGEGGIEPDRQRTTAIERVFIGRPVPGLVGGGPPLTQPS